MESVNRIDKNKQPVVEADIKTSENRRKFIRGGLAGVPVLLALKSTPVLAATCKLPSGFSTSGNLSHNRGSACSNPANGPFFWLRNITSNQFTGTGISTDTKFNDVFALSSNLNSFLVVLNSGISFESLAVAAYLDVKVGNFVNGVSETDIKNMWSGSYTPNGSSIPWTLAEGESYLKYTMG